MVTTQLNRCDSRCLATNTLCRPDLENSRELPHYIKVFPKYPNCRVFTNFVPSPMKLDGYTLVCLA